MFHEITAYLSVFNLFLTQWIMAILSKGCKPGNSESQSSLKLSFVNIQSNTVNVNLSLNQTFLRFLLRQNQLIQLIHMTQVILAISLWGVIFLQQERILFLICMVLQLMWKKDFLLYETYLWKFCRFLLMFLWLYFTLFWFFFLYQSPYSSLCTVFYSTSTNIDEVLLINPSANKFVFGDVTVYHKDWLTYSGKTDIPGELCDNFLISNDLTQMANFSTWIPDCDCHSPALLNFFLSSDTICFAMDSLPLEKSDHIVLSVSIDFPTNSKRDAPLHSAAYDH